MMDADGTLPIYVADDELAALLNAAARAGERVRVRAGEETYVVRIECEPEIATTDIWVGYEPERVLAAVRDSAARGPNVDPANLAPLIAEIRSQRDQASQRPHR